METRIFANASSRPPARVAIGPVMGVWVYAAGLFLIGSAFAFAATFSFRLIPAVFVACLLGGLLASIKVRYRGKE